MDAPEHAKALVRASIQAYFFENVLAPNAKIIERDESAEDVLRSYATFVRTLNRILLRRRSTLLSKQANIFTTNVDMLFEVAMEEIGIDFSDGFSGKIGRSSISATSVLSTFAWAVGTSTGSRCPYSIS